eukprot:TRINITY_DN7705_c0_g1_i1.p1 TRINITY_DN7705_c0_g1~~TRINITY_DN7705_c0_g1_i1.p1  ORF type:complete len:241 (+),score=31.64 TRINITY_DN7705_c0_g1_i1:31-753(+)
MCKLVSVWTSDKQQEVEKPPNALRFVCMSDTHNYHKLYKVPLGDVIICAGDFTTRGTKEEVSSFAEFLKTLPHQNKIVIAGNHDYSLDHNHYLNRFKEDPTPINEPLLKNCTYLQDSSVNIQGIHIYGSPWTPAGVFGWAFGCPEKNLKEHFDKIPENVDILVTHCPPYGYGSKMRNGNDLGSIDLLKRVEQVKPKIHVYGHIHEGYGIYHNKDTTFVNAATYKLNPLVLFDILPPDEKV